MSSISEYTAKVHEYMDATDKVIAAKDKEIERLEDIFSSFYETMFVK